MHEVYASPETMRYVGDGPSENVDGSLAHLERLIAHQEEHGFSMWAVVERESGTVIGDCGLILFAHRGPEVELGFRLRVPFWGRGYATEAATAWIAYGFEELGLDRILAVTRDENAAAQRVLEKIGMRYEGRTDYDGRDVRLYAAEPSS